jgi:hypothetical protein
VKRVARAISEWHMLVRGTLQADEKFLQSNASHIGLAVKRRLVGP